MSPVPPPPAERLPPERDRVPWEDLEALASGELTGDARLALLRRVAREPALRRRYQQVLDLEQALLSEPLWTVPHGLEARILARAQATRGARRPRLLLVGRVAAAALLGFVLWGAGLGAWPTIAQAAEASPTLGPLAALPSAPHDLASLAAGPPLPAWITGPVGTALGTFLLGLGIGLGLARKRSAADQGDLR